MTIQFETPHASNEGILTVSIEKTDLTPRVDKKIKELSQKVALKGFRPGKVPIQLVKKMLGDEVLGEVANELLQNSIQEYFTDNKHLKILGAPLPIESDEAIDLKNLEKNDFKFRCGIVPPFKCDLDNLHVKDYEVILNEDSVDIILQDIQAKYSKYEKADFISSNDIVRGILYDTLHDYSIEENRPQEDEEDNEDNEQDDTKFYREVVLPIAQLNEAVNPHFLNATVGTIIHFDIKELMKDEAKGLHLLTGIGQEAASKLEGDFAFEVTEIFQQTPPELNEELFEREYPNANIKTEEEFRKMIQSDLEKHYKHQNDHLIAHQINDQLLENTQIDIPHDFLKAFFMSREENINVEEMEKTYPEIEKSVRWDIILSELSQTFDIKVTEKEVKAEAFNRIARMFGENRYNPEIVDYISQMVNTYTTKNYNSLMQDVLSMKAMEKIASTLVSPKIIVSEDEFLQIYNSFDHNH